MRKPLIRYLPPVLCETREFPPLMQAAQGEMDVLGAALDDVLGSQFVDDAPPAALARYERILKLYPGKHDDDETRRFRIKARLGERLPFTLPVLRRQLAALCGAEGFAILLDGARYSIRVCLLQEALHYREDVRRLLDRMLPCNLGLEMATESDAMTRQIFIGAVLGRGYTVTRLPEIEPCYDFSHIENCTVLAQSITQTTLPDIPDTKEI